jgi:hypothetical protein
MQLLSNSGSAHWNFPRCCWRFDRAKLGDRPPEGRLTAACRRPHARARSSRQWSQSRRRPRLLASRAADARRRYHGPRTVRTRRIVEDRSLADRIVKMAVDAVCCEPVSGRKWGVTGINRANSRISAFFTIRRMIQSRANGPFRRKFPREIDGNFCTDHGKIF